MLHFRVKEIDLKGIEPKVKFATEKGLYHLTMQVIKDSNMFIPADRWYLRDSSLIHSQPSDGMAVWSTPYARRLYYNPQFNFSKDKNPLAGGLWFERAKNVYSHEWLKYAQNLIRAGL